MLLIDNHNQKKRKKKNYLKKYIYNYTWDKIDHIKNHKKIITDNWHPWQRTFGFLFLSHKTANGC